MKPITPETARSPVAAGLCPVRRSAAVHHRKEGGVGTATSPPAPKRNPPGRSAPKGSGLNMANPRSQGSTNPREPPRRKSKPLVGSERLSKTGSSNQG